MTPIAEDSINDRVCSEMESVEISQVGDNPSEARQLGLKVSAARRTLAEPAYRSRIRAAGRAGRGLAEYPNAAVDLRHFQAKRIMGADGT